MREGEIARPSPGETITCIRSGQSGGPFIFDLELAPLAGRPPTHTHDEGDETIEVLEGEIVFRVSGVDRHLRAGDSLTLTPDDPHTFWNPSKREPVRARVTHGARFERLIAQPDMTSMLMYLAYVDPGASRASSRLMTLLVRVAAWVGRLRGVKPVIVSEQATTEAE
jgi:mannose-6-phosphate isomerase-like protein (cupin superfamily)